MKKIISCFLVVAILCSCFVGLNVVSSAVILPSSGQIGDNVFYTFDSGLLTISGSGYMKDYSPASSENSPFYNQTGIKTVVINSGVTNIGSCVFYCCSAITSINIPNSVTSIGNGAFHGCSGLTSIDIPDSVTSIDLGAFFSCSALTSITIPSSITSIADSAFKRCYSLTSILVASTNPVYDSRENSNAIIETATNTLIIGCQNTNIPDSVTSIGNNAFFDCFELKNIIIPDSVKSIGSMAFYGCCELTEITLPASVIIASDTYSFYSCSRIAKVTFTKGTGTMLGKTNALWHASSCTLKVILEEGIKNIGESAFRACDLLTSISIPNSVKSIGAEAFYGCRNLRDITIPDSVTSIGENSFCYCLGIRNITIPDSVTCIGGYAFCGCNSITNVTLGNSITSIGSSAFSGCNSITNITIPDSVTSIGDNAFYGCNSITNVTLGNSVTSIGNSAFNCCSSLTNVTIPNSITCIGGYAFYGCKSLTNVNFGNSLEIIGDFAFSGCEKLSRIDLPASIKSLGDRTFSGCLSVKEITLHKDIEYVPIKLVNGWYNEYFEGTFHGFATERINFIGTVEDWSKLPYCILSCGTISFNGEIYSNMELNEERINSYFLRGDENISSVSFSPSVTEIGLCAFNGCSHLTKITLPHSITISTQGYVGNDYPLNQDELLTKYAFSNSPISSITFNDNPTELTDKFHYLYKCETLKEFEVPDSVAYIGDGTFKDCQNLTHVTIPKSVTRIEYNAFSGCTNLTISGYKDSYAETFCKWAGIPFEVIEEPHTHSYTAVITPPTCTEQGFTTHTCTCGDSYVDTYTQATGHSWSGWQVEIAANCTENGVEIRQCSNNNSHTESRKIAALGHDYVSEVIQPKATSLGYTRYSCSRCDDTYIKDFKAPTGKLGGFKCKARTSVAQTVTWNKVSSATGYQVQISTKDGKKWSTYANLGSAVNSYTFKKLSAGNNYKFRVRFYIKAADGKNYYSAWSSTLNSPTLPAATFLTKVSAGSKSFTAQWKKQAVTGYQIQYSVNSSFKSAKIITVGSKNTTKKSISKLKGGTKYFVRIRTYKKIGNANYYSAWSKAYTVKTKK